jgi:cobalt/nickel transport system ATP-binding protein
VASAAVTAEPGPHRHAHAHEHAAPGGHWHGHEHDHVDDGRAGGEPDGGWVSIEHLHYAYPDGFEALRGVDLRIERGEKVALVGPNGAGKSTLLLHLNGINRPSHGSVRVAGLAVDERNVRRVRAEVGLVFQDPDDQLFSPTVFDDVAFGPLHMGVPTDEIHRRVERALDAVGMGGSERRLPSHLSIGQRKRVALATVLSMDPSVLVFDEPSAGLDPRGRRQLIELLRSLEQTVVVATHDMRLVAEVLPRTIVMDAGMVVADGTTDAILGDGRLLERHGLEGA